MSNSAGIEYTIENNYNMFTQDADVKRTLNLVTGSQEAQVLFSVLITL